MTDVRYTIMPLDFGSADDCIKVGNDLLEARALAIKYSDEDDGGEPWGVWDSKLDPDEDPEDGCETGFVEIVHCGRVYVETVNRP